MADDILQLRQFESKAIVGLATRGAGTYEQKMLVEGNSLLSTVFVESADLGATVTVSYSDSGVGSDAGEVYQLLSHPAVGTPLASDRRLVTRLHNKPTVKCVVAGGSVRFGVFVTVVSSFAAEIDSALKQHLEDIDLVADRGLPQVFWDTGTNKWYFGLGTAGVQHVQIVGGSVTASIGAVKTPTLANLAMATANTEYSYAFPANTTRFRIQARQPTAKMQIAYVSGNTGLVWKSIWIGKEYEETGLDKATAFTIYLQSNKANTTVEILSWAE